MIDPKKLRHKSSQVVMLLTTLVLAALVMILTIKRFVPARRGDSLEAFVLFLMNLYLIFICARAGLALFFSFAERFFARNFKEPHYFPLVTIILPCFNEEKVIRKAVESVEKLDYPNFEVIIVDDGSSDLTIVGAKSLESRRVRVIHQKNAGKAEALNRGVFEAAGEFVFCMDADSILSPDILKLGIPYFTNNPKLAAVAGNVRIGNDHNMLTVFQKLEYIVGLNFHKTAQSFMNIVTIVPGPCGLFRKSAILDVGGYKTTTFAEDCDLTLRLLMLGYKIEYCPFMYADTEAPEDFTSLLKQRYRWSRGTVQAIKANSYWMYRPWKSLRNFLVMHYFFVESVFIPFMNFLFVLFFLENALTMHVSDILGPFMILLTMLDVFLVAFSVFWEHQPIKLVIYAIFNRLTYGLSMEVLRLLALLDEVIGLPMNWNKLQRKGL